jgi:ABC-type transporter Mla maintaining outer membrane lipid asymmetry permease subunit MlaE
MSSIPHFYRVDFAYSIRSVLYGMALAMAVAAVVGLLGLRAGLQEEPGDEGIAPADGDRVAPAEA